VTSLPSRTGAVDVVSSIDAAAAEFEAELSPLLDDALRLATAMLLNAVEAEDAVQEACLHAWRRRSNRRLDTDIRPWFLAIVANRCRETRRGRWWRLVRVADPPTTSSVASRDTAAVLDLRQALSRLTYRRRLAVVLRYYLDLPYESVASASGCSVDAAKALVRRGTADLERALRGPESRR
jgi:RNA polymerase sigma factor (sigma-70 family)